MCVPSLSCSLQCSAVYEQRTLGTRRQRKPKPLINKYIDVDRRCRRLRQLIHVGREVPQSRTSKPRCSASPDDRELNAAVDKTRRRRLHSHASVVNEACRKLARERLDVCGVGEKEPEIVQEDADEVCVFIRTVK